MNNLKTFIFLSIHVGFISKYANIKIYADTQNFHGNFELLWYELIAIDYMQIYLYLVPT